MLVQPASSVAQQRDLPEELRALAVLCSSGASVKFQGDIEGGINRLFGKIVSGSGSLDISESETEFLSSFNDETLKVEARKVYNDCVLSALQIVYNYREEPKPDGANSVRLLVPDEIATIRSGQRFALLTDGSAMFEEGGVIAVQNYKYKEKAVSVKVSKDGIGDSGSLDIGQNIFVPKTKCHVTLYQVRETGVGDQKLFSFIYQCS